MRERDESVTMQREREREKEVQIIERKCVGGEGERRE